MANEEQHQHSVASLQASIAHLRNVFYRKDFESSDPSPEEKINTLSHALDQALDKCSPANVQTCREWIMKEAAPFNVRLNAIGEHLVVLSESITLGPESTRHKQAAQRVNILYVLSDVFHHDAHHPCAQRPPRLTARELLKGNTQDLFRLAAEYLPWADPKTKPKLLALIKFWETNNIYNAAESDIFLDHVNAIQDEDSESDTAIRPTLPEWFGDRNGRWYDLPPSYMLDPMIKRPDRPIAPRDIRVRNLKSNVVSDEIASLLDEYFENIDLRYYPTGDNTNGQTERHYLGLNFCGQLGKVDKETRQETYFDNGYGWSVELCKDMNKIGAPNSIVAERDALEDAQRLDIERRKGRSLSRDSLSPRGASRGRSFSSGGSSYGRGRSYRSTSRDHGHRRRRDSRSSYDSRDSRSRSPSEDERYSSRRRDSREEVKAPSRSWGQDGGRGNFHRDQVYRGNDRGSGKSQFPSHGQYNQSATAFNPPPPWGMAPAPNDTNTYNGQPGWNLLPGIPQPTLPVSTPSMNMFNYRMPPGTQFPVPPPPPLYPPGQMGGPPGAPNFSGPLQASTQPSPSYAAGNQQYGSNPNYDGSQALQNRSAYGGFQRGGHQAGYNNDRGSFRGGHRGGRGGGYRGRGM